MSLKKKNRKQLWTAVPNKIDAILKIYEQAAATSSRPSLGPRRPTFQLSFMGLREKNVIYLVVLIFVRDLESLHGSDHGLHGREDVLIDQFGKTLFVLVGIAGTMDNPHLFDECALPTLPSA